VLSLIDSEGSSALTRRNAVALPMISLLVFSSLTSVAAALPQYNAKTTPIPASGKNHTFTAGEAIIKCGKAEFKYTGAMGLFSTITVVPSYKECFIKEQEATVAVEKAKFEFGQPKEVTSLEYSLPASIVGETGAKLKVTAKVEGENCEVQFPAQTIAGENTKFVDNGGKTGGEVKAKLEKLEYKSNSKCGGLVPAEGKNGKYEGGAAETGLVIE